MGNCILSIISLQINVIQFLEYPLMLEAMGKQNEELRAVAGMAQWIECQHAHQRVIGSIPSQGTCLSCRPGPQ